MQRRFDLNDASLARSASLDMLLDDIDAFDYDAVSFNHVDTYFALLAFVAARGHQHCVAASNLSHPLTLPLYLWTLA